MIRDARPESVAVIVEWENAILAEGDRPATMLSRLFAQAADYRRENGTRFELLVMYDPGFVDVEVPKQAIAAAAPPEDLARTVRYVKASGLHYYDHKNFGARQTNADVVLFLDSDVIPERDWLRGLLDAFRNPEVKIACGATHLSTHNLAGKLFSLFWFFPIRDDRERGLIETATFFANNVAFRREVFLDHPFPESVCYRGQCIELAGRLRAAGHVIYRETSARTSHPAPNGVSHFMHRAAAAGYDNYMRGRRKGGWLRANPLASSYRLLKSLSSVVRTVYRRAPVLRHGGLVTTAGFLAGVGYYTVAFVTEVATFVAPEAVRRKVSV